jgi:hypothetical protein
MDYCKPISKMMVPLQIATMSTGPSIKIRVVIFKQVPITNKARNIAIPYDVSPRNRLLL